VLEPSAFIVEASVADLPTLRLGRTGGAGLKLADGATISLEALTTEHNRFFPAWMS